MRHTVASPARPTPAPRRAAGSRARVAGAVAASLLLAGCTTFSADGGFGTVADATRERIGQEPHWLRTQAQADAAAAEVRRLLEAPLDADAAVRIALLNNRGLQARYADLGIAEAGVVQAGRLPNPIFGFGRLRRGDDLEIERSIAFDLLGILTLPARSRIAGAEFERTKLAVAADTLDLAARTRRAWFRAVAARESLHYLGQARDAAEAAAELARRMAAAGNFSRLDQAREQLFYAEVSARYARASQAAVVAREELTRLIGLWGTQTGYRLPERLPELPKSARTLDQIEKTAIERRLDVRASVRETELLAESLGLTRATGFVDALHLALQRNSETNAPVQRGFELELPLPLFDWGQARAVRAEQRYLQAVDRVAQTAVVARSEARAAYATYRTAWDLARHYREEIVPLRKRISEESLLRYNGMLIGVFELLADAREQVASVTGYIDALRDFWLADADLQTALTGTTTPVAGLSAGAADAAPKAGGGH